MGGRVGGPEITTRTPAALVSAVLVLAAVALVAYAPWQWAEAADARLKIGLRYPRGWSIDHFENDLGLATHTGVLLSNVDVELRYPDLPSGATTLWDMHDLPDHTVVVEVSRAPRFSVPCDETSPFPLPLPTAAQEPTEPSYGAPPKYFVTACVEGRLPFNVFVYAFPHVDPVDLVRAWQVVASITPSGP